MKYKIIFVLLCLNIVTSSKVLGVLSDDLQRIVGGANVAQGMSPFMAQLWALQSFFVCGGSVISARTVLTAAHCVNFMINPEYYSVIVGSTDLQSTTYRYTVREALMHPDYNSSAYTNDIGLVNLVNDINLAILPVKTIGIDVAPIKTQDRVTVYGWGALYNIGSGNSLDLQTLTLNAISNDECQRRLRGTSMSGISDTHVCAILTVGHGTCSGDAGGPVVRNGYLVGVISQAGTSCGSGFPDVYTRIVPYVKWIHTNMK